MTNESCNCCGAFVDADAFEATGGYCASCDALRMAPPMRAGDELQLPNGTTLRKLQDAQPAGEYKPTAVDACKAAADFRILDVGDRYSIDWRDGRRERVTEKQLAKLQAEHTWATDF